MLGQSGERKDPYHHIAHILKHHYLLHLSVKETIRVKLATGSREDDPGGLQVHLPHFFVLPSPVELQLPVVDMHALAAMAGYPELVQLSLRENKPHIQVHQKFLTD